MLLAQRGRNNVPYCRANIGTTQAIPDNTLTAVVLTTVEFDRWGMINTSTGVFTVPKGWGGVWAMAGGIIYPAMTDGSAGRCQGRLNGATTVGLQQMISGPTTSNVLMPNLSDLQALNSGDTVEMLAFHISGVSRTLPNNAATHLSMVWLAPL